MRPRRLVIAVAIILFALAGLFVVNLITDFADVPCQDGIWDAARKTCIPLRAP